MKKTAKSTEPVTLSLSCYYKQGDDLDNHYNVALEDKAGGCVEAAALRAWAADLAASAKHLATLEAGTHMVELTVTAQLAAKIAALDLPIVSQPQRPSCQ
jgi:hypothetical protein